MLSIDVRPPVAWLALDRPDKLNAMTRAFFGELAAALEEVEADGSVRVVVLHGNGRCFSVGGDLAAFGELDGVADRRSYMREAMSAFRAVEECRTPTIAAVHGHALGGGCELTLVCDLVVADETARFGLPETAVGLVPGPGLVRGRAHLGLHALKYLILTGEPLDATAGPGGGPRQRGRAGGRAPREGRGVGGDARRAVADSRSPPPRTSSPQAPGTAPRTPPTRSPCCRGAPMSPRASPRSARSALRHSPAGERADLRSARRARAPPRGGARHGRRRADRAAACERAPDRARAPGGADRSRFLVRARAARRGRAPAACSRRRPMPWSPASRGSTAARCA